MSDTPRPVPPVPGTLDLRAFPKMFMDTGVLLGSDLADIQKTSPDGFRAAILLRLMSWQQVPAASLPGDERRLAALIGLSPQKWKTVREVALRGFVACADGRFYHPDVVDEALAAHSYRSKQQAKARKRWEPQVGLDLGDKLGVSGGRTDATAYANKGLGSEFLLPSDGGPFTLPAWVPKDSWAAFVQMRREIRAPMTARAMGMICDELTKISGPSGADVGAILDQSTRNNWKDVYALKERGVSVAGTRGGGLADRNSDVARRFAQGVKP